MSNSLYMEPEERPISDPHSRYRLTRLPPRVYQPTPHAAELKDTLKTTFKRAWSPASNDSISLVLVEGFNTLLTLTRRRGTEYRVTELQMRSEDQYLTFPDPSEDEE